MALDTPNMAMMVGTAGGWLCGVVGVLALRRAWRRPSSGPWMAVGWSLLLVAVFGWAMTTGPDVAVALALLIPSLTGFAVVGAGIKIRAGKASRVVKGEVELASGPRAPWRAMLRTFYAGPLAGLAAFSCAAAVALKAPGIEADRLVAGGLLAPVLWAAGMVWATTDSRLARVGLGLAAGSIASLALAAA